MEENKYWFVVLILRSIIILLLFDISKDMVNHGEILVGRLIQISTILYLFYAIGKNFNNLMK